ncbi:MAG: glycosyltransferase family 1 protein [Candidatus Omnitrophica bacterium]|nr:glycosyltransferase family 1 protein [Candidatus Omnitrophota bacterium]
MQNKIFFDARMIDHPGIGRYIRCLLPLMAEDKTLELVLLGNRAKIKKFLGVEKNIIDFDYPIYSIQEQLGFLRLKKEIASAAEFTPNPCGSGRPRNDVILHIPHYNIPVLAKFNLVATIHDIIHIAYPEGASGRLAPLYMKFMLKRILKSAKAVICVSRATKDEIEKRCMDSRFRGNDNATTKLHVIYEGVDKTFTKITDLTYLKNIKEKYKLPDKFILYVGSIRRHKNIGALLDSFSQFKKRVPEACLIMVGRLSQDIDIKRDGVIYLGEIESDKELAAVYNLASCLFNLSLYEGFGLTILEAQKCGLPVVCSDIAVHKEIGGDGIAAVEASYIDQICDNLYNILFNRGMRESLILRGLKNADRFDWRKTAQNTIDLYRKIDNGPGFAMSRNEEIWTKK